ncbi:MAG: phenylphosphate carboxylase subunit gamma, partial [Candidatus Binatia bacterium]
PMASKTEQQTWETFVRRPGDLKEAIEMPMVLRDLTSGKKKYQMRHVVAVVSRKAEEMASMDILQVRTVVGVLLSEIWGIRILKDLPTELPGRPYQDFYEALRKASSTEA